VKGLGYWFKKLLFDFVTFFGIETELCCCVRLGLAELVKNLVISKLIKTREQLKSFS